MLIALSHTRLWIHVFVPSSSHFTSMKWCNTTVHYSQLFHWKIKIEAPQIMLLIKSRACSLLLPSLSGVRLGFLAVTWCQNVSCASENHFSVWIFSSTTIVLLPFDKSTLPLHYKDTVHYGPATAQVLCFYFSLGLQAMEIIVLSSKAHQDVFNT